MKNLFIMIFLAVSFSGCLASCGKDDDDINNANPTENTSTMENGKIKIKIGSHTFTATLSDNASAKAFKAMLPLTINMTELNGNEKYYDFKDALPSNAINPGNISNGNLMLYGSKTLVLFYKNFSTSYSYTKLGKLDNANGLETALGGGNVNVTFELN
ncbi:hypothetical protein K0U91_12075 [Chryseobacterium chendengshani]|uniref:cyclophilin-like fold protein n=1 Tax=Chryseobacterium sp. LJ668 TaxID=2864040 RepID=UPI001C687823|nr:cyclophilin-like fold protein [Chryseobacterium sp. LJ668]MBW8523508.1 hypothetical protein [Chryseobacterium sp. LJ668]QYK15791.1 hypothetical protein K0U91_12075 [Chryseobacterium sp. LJ668]